jgi:hypothetical protein
MEVPDLEPASSPLAESARRPSTVVVLALLAGVALIFSYLIAYAMTNALVAAEVITRWAPTADPRPRYFAKTFFGLMGVFVMGGTIARLTTRRQMRRLEELELDADTPLS